MNNCNSVMRSANNIEIGVFGGKRNLMNDFQDKIRRFESITI
jgi:hypothetical protein